MKIERSDGAPFADEKKQKVSGDLCRDENENRERRHRVVSNVVLFPLARVDKKCPILLQGGYPAKDVSVSAGGLFGVQRRAFQQ
jgi:hypothetical protein